MKTSSHLDKFERLRALRARLDPFEDFELWLWTTVAAGTNALGACLRLAGLAGAAEPGSGTAAAGPRACRRPAVETLPEDIRRLARALAAVEGHRDPCVRDARAPTRAIVDECESAFAQMSAVLRRRCDWSLL